MQYTITVQPAIPHPYAAVPDRATLADLPRKIIANSGIVWQYLKSNKIPNDGHNIVLYFPDPAAKENPLLTPEGIAIEVGARTLAPFTPPPPIIASATPAGTVATTTHIGPYHLLGQAHAALCQWSKQNHQPLAGPNWELYGHWTDDESQLRTDVYYLLK